MKNIHILPTEKPSFLYKDLKEKIGFNKSYDNIPMGRTNQHIYITSDEEIKVGDCVYSSSPDYNIQKVSKGLEKAYNDVEHYKKIILTTDQELIADGVQEIDDEFLEWFVKNPSCDYVEVQDISMQYFDENHYDYKTIIPKEETKQERMYSEEEVLDILFDMKADKPINLQEWFEQFKKNTKI